MNGGVVYKSKTKETHRLLCSRCQETSRVELTVWPNPQAKEELFYSWTCPTCGTGHLGVRFHQNGENEGNGSAGEMVEREKP